MKFDEIVIRRQNKTIYRDGENCIKVFDEDYSKADVLNEALNNARIENIGLCTPKIKEVMMVDGKWAIVTDFIEGKTLEELMLENPDKIDEYLDIFVDLQIEMHSKKCTSLNRLKDKMRRKIDETTLDDTTKYELHTRIEGMPRHRKVCHGDFNPSNIIVTPEGQPYIIDWAHVTQGNASADVARTYLLFNLEGKGELAERYLELFCEKSKTAKKYVQSWLPIVAASQSVKGNEHERQFLLSWVNVVDFE